MSRLAMSCIRRFKSTDPCAMLTCRLLLVDDNPAHRRLMAKTLTDAGARVDVAENGRAALDLVQRTAMAGEAIDAIVMDLDVPVLDGHSAAQSLRRLGYTMPLIAISANMKPRIAAACFESGFNAFVPKSDESSRLVHVISQLVNAGADG